MVSRPSFIVYLKSVEYRQYFVEMKDNQNTSKYYFNYTKTSLEK